MASVKPAASACDAIASSDSRTICFWYSVDQCGRTIRSTASAMRSRHTSTVAGCASSLRSAKSVSQKAARPPSGEALLPSTSS